MQDNTLSGISKTSIELLSTQRHTSASRNMDTRPFHKSSASLKDRGPVIRKFLSILRIELMGTKHP